MQLIVSGKNVHVSGSLKSYTEKKIGKLDHYLPTLTNAHVVFTKEKTKKGNQTHLVQVTLQSNGSVIRGEQRADEFPGAVDAVMEKLYKEIDRWKGRHNHHRDTGERVTIALQKADAMTAPQIVRRKRFATPPMTEKQALKEMDKLGHDFFLFMNRATDSLNVLYRRKDGDYGLIQTEPED